MLFRITQAAAWFLSARIILLYVGQEQYGFVAVILSLAAWLQMLDFGVTSYLRSEFPKARAEGGSELAARYFKSGVTRTTAVATSILLALNLLLYIVPAVPRHLVQLVSSADLVEPGELALLITGLSCYALLLICGNLLQAYLAAFERQYIFFYLGMLGCVLQPLIVWWTAARGHGLTAVFYGFCLTFVAPIFAYFIYTLARTFPVTTSLRGFRLLNTTSLSFLLIQLGGAVASNLDLLLVSHFFGLTKTATYSIFKLIVQFPISVHAQFNLQSWPIYSVLSGQPGEYLKLKELVMRNVKIAAVAALLLASALTTAGPWFISFWSNGTLQATYITAFLFSLYGGLYMALNTFSVLMFSFNYTKSTIGLVLTTPPLLVVLAWTLKWMGYDAVILSNVFVYGVGLTVGVAFYLRIVSPSTLRAGAEGQSSKHFGSKRLLR